MNMDECNFSMDGVKSVKTEVMDLLESAKEDLLEDEGMMMSTMSLLNLPDSLILNILSYLDHVEVCQMAQTCSRLTTVCDDDVLWRNLFIRHFRVDPGVYLDPLGEF
jgi:hypothetical protein